MVTYLVEYQLIVIYLLLVFYGQAMRTLRRIEKMGQVGNVCRLLMPMAAVNLVNRVPCLPTWSRQFRRCKTGKH